MIWSVEFTEILIREQIEMIVIFYTKCVRFRNKIARFIN